ncbi:MAG: tryptophan--tRNA ligase [Gammaproteobacteria bacterium]|nr:tryptophan--tRNA ligase [Gammaproteobacteria bacterium]
MEVIHSDRQRVLSGMRPTGALHLGHYHGVLKNWLAMQHEYDCFFFVADWHALTTEYENQTIIGDATRNMVIDWLAVGIDPSRATLFVQSQVPEHAELHLLLSMITPLGWLERVPTYKDQQERLREKDLGTYGFLGYPLLQSADILIYRAGLVPVGEDQVAHVELTREVARRFNHLYGREADFVPRAKAVLAGIEGIKAKKYKELRQSYQERGDHEALGEGRLLVAGLPGLSAEDRERLAGYLEGEARIILPEPRAALTPMAKMPGLDGQKMSKSYGNTIGLREDPDSITRKMRTMPTDPARVRRTDPGEPLKCPVWPLHEVYSDEDTKEWVLTGCRGASIGCIECKQRVIDRVIAEVAPIAERARELENDPAHVRQVMREGAERARAVAGETMEEVRRAIGLVGII